MVLKPKLYLIVLMTMTISFDREFNTLIETMATFEERYCRKTQFTEVMRFILRKLYIDSLRFPDWIAFQL